MSRLIFFFKNEKVNVNEKISCLLLFLLLLFDFVFLKFLFPLVIVTVEYGACR